MQIIQKPKNNDYDNEQAALDDLARKRGNVNKYIEELEKRSSHLPLIEENDKSISPGTEDSYAQKDEAVLKLKGAVRTLEKSLPILNKAISRRQHNLDITRSDSERLILEDAQDHYLAAEEELGKQLRKLMGQRKSMNDVLKRARLALEIAESKKLPGGKVPQRKETGDGTSESVPTIAKTPATPPMRGPGGILPVGPVVGIPKPPLRGETDGLLSIGPL